MLSDPQSVTINGVATTLARTQLGPNQSTYSSGDGNVAMITKQNTTAQRFRREVRLTSKKIAADPISAVNKESGFSVYIVIDEPRSGVFSDTEISYVVEALEGWFGSVNQAKLLSGEY